ncbi:MAG: T9SS type A sorting domain-containing protein [Bacteroidetes bacterium]|nr:T9SS type A sorting domain-containing protein [Bacteroidota bacterium]
MKKIILFSLVSLFVILAGSVYAQSVQEKYSKVRIYATSENDFNKMTSSGLFLEGGIHKKGEYFETWLSETEIASLNKSGVPYQITVNDWMEYYNSFPPLTSKQFGDIMKNSRDNYNVYHNILGSMGGNLKVAEIINKLDSLRIEYPNLVSVKWSLGNTFEGRPMWTVRITKNPDAPTGRPEIWYNGVTHAREPGGMMNVLYYVYWLVENYGTDPIATYILNNREIYWTPIINVDGYYYNETTNPTGGGMWRANRHVTTGSCGYVDLNRNFGTWNFWNSSNGGSSTDACAGGQGTYRGLYPMSEPELVNWKNFENSRNFRCEVDYHTYGNYLIKPYAWCDPTPTPDDAIFNQFGTDIVAVNHFAYGTPLQTVGYTVRGGSTDWVYSTDSTGHSQHVFCFSPEVGVIGFWSNAASIVSEAQTCFFQNQYLALVAGAYVNTVSTALNKPTYVQGESGNFKIVFKNKGLASAQNVKVEFIPQTTYLTVPTQVYIKASLGSFLSDSTTFNFSIGATCPNNSVIKARLRLKQDDTVTVYDKMVNIFVGTGYSILRDSAENGTTNFPTMTNWAIVTNKYLSPTHSFKGSCLSSTVSQMVSVPLNVSAYPSVYLSWYQKFALETGYDYGFVDVSSNNGTTWQRIATFNGLDSASWKLQSFDISSLVTGSTNMLIRFRDSCDTSLNWDGWYVDNINVTAYALTPTTAGNTQGIVPDRFSLEQNYPNPFNPVTQISYAVPKDGFVRISVYDVLGREVKTLVGEIKKAGYYSVDFDGSGLSSGYYFYRMESANFIETKKMMLVK